VVLTILDGKNPRFFMTVQTPEGRWMVARVENGKPVVESSFEFSSKDAEAIATAWNRREMDLYKSESAKHFDEWIKARPTLEKIAQSRGSQLWRHLSETGGYLAEHSGI
jgi:hypothetical protein